MKNLFLVIISIPFILGAYIYFSSPGKFYPWPYRFESNANLVTQNQLDNLGQAELLVLGDLNGVHFRKYEQVFRRYLDPKIMTLPIVNLSQRHHGIHRSLRKLGQMSHLPELIIFFAGQSENYESKLDIRAVNKFERNLQVYSDLNLRTLFYLLPRTSNFFYQDQNLVTFQNEIKKNSLQKTVRDQQTYLQYLFKLYESEIESLIDKIFEQDKTLILITSPINLDNLPNTVCSNSTSTVLNTKLTAYAKNLLAGDYKMALIELKKLQESIKGNARLEYLLGRSYFKQGNFEKSKEHFYLANAYDCFPQGPMHILNSIIRKKAIEYEIPLIDLDIIVNKNFGKDVVFFNEATPQEVHYNKFLKTLAAVINKHYKH